MYYSTVDFSRYLIISSNFIVLDVMLPQMRLVILKMSSTSESYSSSWLELLDIRLLSGSLSESLSKSSSPMHHCQMNQFLFVGNTGECWEMPHPQIRRNNVVGCFVDRWRSVVWEVSEQVDTHDRVDTLSESKFCHFQGVKFR